MVVGFANTCGIQGRIQGGGGAGRTRRAPALKLEKIWFFGVKSWFFTRNTSTIFAPPSARRNFFKCAPPPNFEITDPPLESVLITTKIVSSNPVLGEVYSIQHYVINWNVVESVNIFKVIPNLTTTRNLWFNSFLVSSNHLPSPQILYQLHM